MGHAFRKGTPHKETSPPPAPSLPPPPSISILPSPHTLLVPCATDPSSVVAIALTWHAHSDVRPLMMAGTSMPASAVATRGMPTLFSVHCDIAARGLGVNGAAALHALIAAAID